MRVTLISHTANAVELLLFTKSTRLQMSPSAMIAIIAWSDEKKQEELAKMARTIKSSWEFLDTTFLIEGVSRACAQQITRTRNASYAMQSQRVNDARAVFVVNSVKSPEMATLFNHAAGYARKIYGDMVDAGVPLEDARGILPMNSECNLVAKYNFRAFTDLVKARQSLRAQGEYNQVVIAMKEAVLKAWLWSEPFFASEHETAIKMIEGVAKEIGIKTGSGPGWELAKAADLLRKGKT